MTNKKISKYKGLLGVGGKLSGFCGEGSACFLKVASTAPVPEIIWALPKVWKEDATESSGLGRDNAGIRLDWNKVSNYSIILKKNRFRCSLI